MDVEDAAEVFPLAARDNAGRFPSSGTAKDSFSGLTAITMRIRSSLERFCNTEEGSTVVSAVSSSSSNGEPAGRKPVTGSRLRLAAGVGLLVDMMC